MGAGTFIMSHFLLYRLVKVLWNGARVCLALLLLAVGGVGALNAWVVFSTVGRIVSEVPVADAGQRIAVVLGTSPQGGFLQNRLDTVIDLYNSGAVRQILLTGDGRGPFYDEVAFMRRVLLAADIPEDALLSDPLGLRTRESMQRASETYQLDRVVIVSQRFHNFRALYLARAKGLDAIAIDAGEPGGLNWRMQWREWLARPLAVWEVWNGKVTQTLPQRVA